MEDLLDQIERASKSGLYYVALFTALTVPNLCSALDAPNGQHSGNRYMKWVESHVPGWQEPGAGKLLWQFRGSLLHEGSGRPHEKSKGPRLIFMEPGGPVLHNVTVEMGAGPSALFIDVPKFCIEMVAAARHWLDSARGSQPFETNFERFVRRHVEGIAPFVTGSPVIG